MVACNGGERARGHLALLQHGVMVVCKLRPQRGLNGSALRRRPPTDAFSRNSADIMVMLLYYDAAAAVHCEGTELRCDQQEQP